MPTQFYGGGGGLQIPINFQRGPVDPTDAAIKQAHLNNLLQEPKFKERELTLQELGLKSTDANHAAMQRLQEAGLLETIRSNKVKEATDVSQLGESTRHNLVGEGLTSRGQDLEAASRDATNQTAIRGQDLEVTAKKESNQTEITKALIHTLLTDYTNPNHVALTAETLDQLGFPQLKKSLTVQPVGTAGANPEDEALKKALTGYFGGKKAGATPSTTPVPNQSREATRPTILDYFRK